MVKIAKYLNENLIFFINAQTRDQVIDEMVEGLDRQNRLPNKELFHQFILEREKVVSTGIGMGVAVPHAKIPAFDDFFIAIGILQKGVEWNALDSASVRLVFMIGGPDDKQTEYLQILSSLTTLIKDEERRKKLLTLNSAKGIIALFKDY